MNNILVTGSNGYIGTVLVSKLINKGYKVAGIDTLYFKNSSLGKYTINYPLIKKDIRNLEDINLSNYDGIIHLAALCNDLLGEIRPQATLDINYRATLNLARKAKKAGVKRFIFSSSCSIYGAKRGEILSENSRTIPVTAYAKSKLLSEKALVKLADRNFCVGILRNSTVYGFSPKLRNDIVVNNLVSSSILNNKINILSDGTPWRALIDIRDLANIFMEFLKVDDSDINGEVFNVGFNENNIQVREIVNEIQKQLPNCITVYQNLHDKKYDLNYRVNFNKFHKVFSHIKQEWPLSRSINHLIGTLKKEHLKKEDISSGKFNRLATINLLLEKEILDNNLYWNSKSR